MQIARGLARETRIGDEDRERFAGADGLEEAGQLSFAMPLSGRVSGDEERRGRSGKGDGDCQRGPVAGANDKATRLPKLLGLALLVYGG